MVTTDEDAGQGKSEAEENHGALVERSAENGPESPRASEQTEQSDGEKERGETAFAPEEQAGRSPEAGEQAESIGPTRLDREGIEHGICHRGNGQGQQQENTLSTVLGDGTERNEKYDSGELQGSGINGAKDQNCMTSGGFQQLRKEMDGDQRPGNGPESETSTACVALEACEDHD